MRHSVIGKNPTIVKAPVYVYKIIALFVIPTPQSD
jgi:hypothetical protein